MYFSNYFMTIPFSFISQNSNLSYMLQILHLLYIIHIYIYEYYIFTKYIVYDPISKHSIYPYLEYASEV